MLAIVSLFLVVVNLPHVCTTSAPRLVPGGRSQVEDGKLGAVASESAICSRAGTDMLERGGNAADAVSWL